MLFWWFSRFLFLLLSSIPSGLSAGYLPISLAKCVSWMSLARVNESVVADLVHLSLLICEVNIDSFFLCYAHTPRAVQKLCVMKKMLGNYQISLFPLSYLKHMLNLILLFHGSFFYLFILWCIFSSHHLLFQIPATLQSPWNIPFGQISLLLGILIWKVYPVIPFWLGVNNYARQCLEFLF